MEEKELLAIRESLTKGEIEYSEAFELIKKMPKPWHRKEWSSKRDSIIKSACEQCGTSEGTMVAQHLVHPREFKDIRDELFNRLFDEILSSTNLPKPVVSEEDMKDFHERTTKMRQACPQCKWIYIRARKTMTPKFICEKCKIEFEEPILIKYNEVFKTIFPNQEQVVEYLTEKKEKEIRWNFRQEVFKKHEREIGRKALLINIDQHLQYMELKDVMTFCKRCATKMDLEGKLLCWTCKTEYFNYLLYNSCYSCYAKNGSTRNPIKDSILKLWQDNYQ